jgi:hypothetical protein
MEGWGARLVKLGLRVEEVSKEGALRYRSRRALSFGSGQLRAGAGQRARLDSPHW